MKSLKNNKFILGETDLKELTLKCQSGKSKVIVGENVFNLEAFSKPENIIVISDSTLLEKYSKHFENLRIIKIGSGEEIKTMETIKEIYRQLIKYGAEKNTYILGFGGGIVCDICGFAASTFLGGLPFGFAPTSLLSQVDASVGGKNGVNLLSYKNMIGLFKQAKLVICDTSFLKTLPKSELISGMAEIIKAAAIANKSLFEYLEENARKVLSLDMQVLEKLIYEALLIKADIVQKDEKENNERRKLNFGHTFAHALEKVEKIPHGKAVAIGLVIASKISLARSFIKQKDLVRIENVLKQAELPLNINSEKKLLIDALKKDKKRQEASINFVLLKKIGEAIVQEITINELEKVFYDMS